MKGGFEARRERELQFSLRGMSSSLYRRMVSISSGSLELQKKHSDGWLDFNQCRPKSIPSFFRTFCGWEMLWLGQVQKLSRSRTFLEDLVTGICGQEQLADEAENSVGEKNMISRVLSGKRSRSSRIISRPINNKHKELPAQVWAHAHAHSQELRRYVLVLDSGVRKPARRPVPITLIVLHPQSGWCLISFRSSIAVRAVKSLDGPAFG